MFISGLSTRHPRTNSTAVGTTAGIPHHQNMYDLFNCLSEQPDELEHTRSPSPLLLKTEKRKKRKGTTHGAKEAAEPPKKRDNEKAVQSTIGSNLAGQLDRIFDNALEEVDPFVNLNVHRPEGADDDLVFVAGEEEGDDGVIALDDNDDGGGGWGSEMIERVAIDW